MQGAVVTGQCDSTGCMPDELLKATLSDGSAILMGKDAILSASAKSRRNRETS
jgi:hypothetical protein